ncbi:MAG TPA: ribosome silencing factor [Rectinemataceae bacterium]|nr:ribosome silencing factor [Rectinemataceae bacterium]
MSDSKSLAFNIASILAEHNAGDVLVMDLTGIAGWTDYFVIGTCTSNVHLRGLSRFVDGYLTEDKQKPLNKPVATEDESWLLQDLGDVIVHIMNKEARAFYELEKLWFKAKVFKIEASQGKQEAAEE